MPAFEPQDFPNTQALQWRNLSELKRDHYQQLWFFPGAGGSIYSSAK